MTRLVLLTSSLLLLSAAAYAGEAASSAPPYPQHINWVTFALPGGGEAKVYYGEKVVYVTSPEPGSDSPRPESDSVGVVLRSISDILLEVEVQMAVRVGDDPAISNKYAKLADGSTGRFTFASSDPTVVEAFNGDTEERGVHKAGELVFSGRPGKAIITVSLVGDVGKGAVLQSVDIPLEAVQIPVHRRDSKDAVVEALGVPDARNNQYVESPGGSVDGIYYAADRHHSRTCEHWFYKRYPGLIIYVDDSGVGADIEQRGWYDCEHCLTYDGNGDLMVAEGNKALPYCGWVAPPATETRPMIAPSAQPPATDKPSGPSLPEQAGPRS